METISLDYANVCNEVSRLKAIASELQGLQSSARNALAELNSYWEGAAADAFLAENERRLKEMDAIQNEVDSLAALIKHVADEIREAEMRAAAAIKGMGGISND